MASDTTAFTESAETYSSGERLYSVSPSAAAPMVTPAPGSRYSEIRSSSSAEPMSQQSAYVGFVLVLDNAILPKSETNPVVSDSSLSGAPYLGTGPSVRSFSVSRPQAVTRVYGCSDASSPLITGIVHAPLPSTMAETLFEISEMESSAWSSALYVF